MAKNRVITVQGIPVTVSYEDIDDFICITDIAAAKSDNSRAADVIRNWLRRFTKGYYIKQLKMDCQPTEFTALSRHRAVFSWAGKGGIPICGA